MTEVTLITGASVGLGEEFAKQLAQQCKTLLLVARRTDKLETLAQELRTKHKIEVFIEPADLSAPAAVKKLMVAINKRGLVITRLVNNAGFGLKGEFAALDGKRQIEMINLNITALTELCHAVLPGMIQRKSGEILNVASTAAFQAGPLMAVYYASKAYVLSFSEALHEEVKAQGIKVSCLCPGPTQTEFAAAANLTKTALFKLPGGPGAVASDGLAALNRNQAFIVSGLRNKLTAQATRFAPRSVTRNMAKSMQQ